MLLKTTNSSVFRPPSSVCLPGVGHWWDLGWGQAKPQAFIDEIWGATEMQQTTDQSLCLCPIYSRFYFSSLLFFFCLWVIWEHLRFNCRRNAKIRKSCRKKKKICIYLCSYIWADVSPGLVSSYAHTHTLTHTYMHTCSVAAYGLSKA